MKTFKISHWSMLLAFAAGIHVVYIGFILVAAGSLITKKSVETVLTAMNLDGAAKFLTPSVMDMAFEQVVVTRAENQVQMERALAAEHTPPVPMPEVYRQYRGRGLLSEDDVINISAIETQVRQMPFEVVPEAVEFPKEIPATGVPATDIPIAPPLPIGQ